MANTSPPLAEPAREPVSAAILDAVLRPYQTTQTDYLRRALVNPPPAPDSEEIISLTGTYTIPGSCYIDSTGHFNAVELVICYNQLAYTVFGYLTFHGLLADVRISNRTPAAEAELRRMTFQRFLDRQLSSMFILKTALRFRGVIDPKAFSGTVVVEKIAFRQGTFFIHTRCQFVDAADGSAGGEILLAYPTDPLE